MNNLCCSFPRLIPAAMFFCVGLAALTTQAQSPLFPNTSPVYNNPYGVPSSNPNGPFYRGVQFPLKPLPAAYSQPLPAPPPSVMAQFGSAPYNYGANSNVRVFNGTTNYQPTRNPNWAPNFSSR
jgi:hypothetical protein